MITPPEVEVESYVLFKPGTTKVRILNPNGAYLAGKLGSINVEIDSVSTGAYKDYHIKANQHAKDFELDIIFGSGVLDRIQFIVTEYPDLAEIDEYEMVPHGMMKENNLIVLDLDEDHKLPIEIPYDSVSGKKGVKYYAQLYRPNGTKLGDNYEFVKDEAEEVYAASLNMLRGINPGDQVRVEISTPYKVVKSIPIYAKPKLRDQIVVNAGFSLMEINPKKNASGNYDVQVLNGVNLGVYYMIDSYRFPGAKILGVGPNLYLSEINNELSTRMGVSILLFEKVMLE